jgi:hypothetical protein
MQYRRVGGPLEGILGVHSQSHNGLRPGTWILAIETHVTPKNFSGLCRDLTGECVLDFSISLYNELLNGMIVYSVHVSKIKCIRTTGGIFPRGGE